MNKCRKNEGWEVMDKTIKCPTCRFEWFPREFRDFEANAERDNDTIISLTKQIGQLEEENKNLKRELEQDSPTEIVILQGKNQQLREALEKIASSKYCNYANTSPDLYGIGVTDGHRYCAEIAKQALEEK